MLNFLLVTIKNTFSNNGVFKLEYEISEEAFERLKKFQEKKGHQNIDETISIVISNLYTVLEKTLFGRYGLFELPIAGELVTKNERRATKFKLRYFDLKYLWESFSTTFANRVLIKFETDYRLYLNIVGIKFFAGIFYFDDVLDYALAFANYISDVGLKRKKILLVSKDLNKAYGLINY